jgi:beta-glucosidase
MTHCSQEEGSALASVLFGDFNPGGRLVQTWPRAITQLPSRLDYDIRKGRTYMYFKGQPLYPFGFGLSYTTFKYSNLKVSSDNIQTGKPLTISFDITNTGKRAGDEVAQLYVRHLHSEVQRPQKELKGFERITIQPGETKTVSLKLHAKDLAYWNEIKKAFTVEPDRIQLQIDSSSDDIRLTEEVQVKE